VDEPRKCSNFQPKVSIMDHSLSDRNCFSVNLVVFLFYLSDLRFIVDANKEVGLEIKAEKTKCMLLSRHQNAW
jgi:hypothetical protein